MKTTNYAVFFSHSTRDILASDLAHKLAAGLEGQGVRVWIAPESIPPGERWEEALVREIAQTCTHFVILLSEAAIRSDWVVKEIKLIRQRWHCDPSVKVLPLRVGQLSSFAGEEFLRAFQDVPYSEQFATQLRTLAETVGLPPLLPAVFRNLIAESTKDFVGREEVFASIQQFVSTEKKGTFFLLGEPGQGKTAILAEYVRRTGSPAHFNIATAGIDTTAQFFDSLEAQLRTNYGAASLFHRGETPSISVRLAELLERAADLRPEGEPLVIVIDALDEVKDTGSDGANILQLPPVLSDGIFLLMSGRCGDYRFVSRDPQKPYDLTHYSAQNRRDIDLFLTRRLSSPSFEPWLVTKDWTLARAVEELGSRSEENFMYLHYVLQEIERGNFSDPKEQLPVGLRGYYSDHWRRMGMANRPASELKLDVLQILALVRGSVGARLIADILRVKVEEVRAVLDEWRGFLHVSVENGSSRYRLYHSSFRDFLASKEALQDRDPQRWQILLVEHFAEGGVA